MSIISFVLHILPILLLTTPTASLITDPITITAHIPRSTSAPLTECASVCALMETQIRQPPGPDQGSLFRSLCINSGRTDCDALQAEFRIELVGKADGFKCLCARNDPGKEYASTTTTTSTSTITMTEGINVPVEDATSVPAVEESASTSTAEAEKAADPVSTEDPVPIIMSATSASINTESTQSSVATPTSTSISDPISTSISDPISTSISDPISTSISDPISTAPIETSLPTTKTTILSTHTTLSTIRYAVSPTSKSTSTAESSSTATPNSSEAELNTDNQPEVSKKLKGGAIVGVVLGVFAACAIIGGGMWYIRKRQMAKAADKQTDYDY